MFVPPFFPGQNHLRPENQVLVEQVRDAAGKLNELARIRATGEILLERPELPAAKQTGQGLHYFPKHHLAFEGWIVRHGRQDGPKHLVGEGFGKPEPGVGADAVIAGQFQLEPAFHALVAHDDDLRLERRQQPTP